MENIDFASIDSPIALIALFIVVIESLIVIAIAKTQNAEQRILIRFFVSFPVLISVVLFIFLWEKPMVLHSPKNLSERLQNELVQKEINPQRVVIEGINEKMSNLKSSVTELTRD